MKRRIPGILFLLMACKLVLTAQENASVTQLDCIAHYLALNDSLNPSLVNFYDESTGNPTTWHWNFGDPESGSDNTSDLQNPLHQFTSYGVFTVCLTITNTDPLHPCNNSVCDTVVVDLTHHCHADFDFVPDTANPVTNTFNFIDLSTGNPNQFLWNFGDGTTSDMRNPVHHYTKSGDYNVCLKIILSDSTGILCSDSLCEPVHVMAYFNIGGHAFAGLFPINNPVSTGDTAIAYLYQLNSYNPALKDTVEFFHLGYFTFPNTPAGQYIIKVALKPTSVHYQNYLTTWFPDVQQQENAQVINISDSNVYNADIHLHALTPGIPGYDASGGDMIISEPFPDPPADVIYLKIWSSLNTDIKMAIRTIPGRVMGTYYFPLVTGQNTVRIAVGELPAGMYLILSGLQDGSNHTVRKFIKQ
jgi:hypothetical protein